MSEIQQALQDASRALERATTAFRSASVGHFRRTEIRPEPKQLLAAAAEIVCAQGLIALAMRRCPDLAKAIAAHPTTRGGREP